MSFKKHGLVLALAGGLSCTACGVFKKKSNDSKGGGNESADKAPLKVQVETEAGISVLWDKTFDSGLKVGDTSLTVNRVRAWQRNPKSEFESNTAGDAPDFDLVTVDLWFTLDGETQQRYRRISGLRMASDGWLFPDESLGGKPPHADSASPFDYYQRTDAEGFIVDEKPLLIDYLRTTNIILDASKNVVQRDVVGRVRFKLNQGGTLLDGTAADPAFSGLRLVDLAQSANLLGSGGTRTVWSKNEKVDGHYQQVGRMACIVETRDGGNTGNGNFNPPKVLFGDVELGELIDDAEGRREANIGTDNGNCDSHLCQTYSGYDPTSDDMLWVERKEAFFVTGINIAAGHREIRVMKKAFAPFYLSRQLPTPMDSANVPISGIEALVRRCNDMAVQNASSVAANKLLKAPSAAAGEGQFDIMPSIGFRLVANARADKLLTNGYYVSDFLRFCDAMPDSQSPSSSLVLNYSSLQKTVNQTIPGIQSCGDTYNSASLSHTELQGQPLGIVLDKQITQGTWDSTIAHHDGKYIVPSRLAADRPMLTTQAVGSGSLE